LALLLACALAAPVAPAHAGPAEDIAALTAQVEEALGASQPAHAEAAARAGLHRALAEYGDEHLVTANLHRLLGDALFSQDRYAEAEPHYRQAAATREKLLGTYHADTAVSINDLAISLRRQQRYAEALPLYEKVLDIREQVLGTNAPDTARSTFWVARLLQSLGRDSDAAAVMGEAVARAKAAFGATDRNTIQWLGEAADLLQAAGDLAAAERVYLEANALGAEALASDDPLLAYPLQGLARLYAAEDRVAEAVPLFRDALSIREAAYGAEDRDTLASVDGLARALWASGEISEAEGLFRRLLAVRQRTDGPDSLAAADLLRWIGRAASAGERKAEAEIVFKRVLAISEAQLGPDHVLTGFDLIALGQLYAGQQRFDEARPLLERAVDVLAQYREDGGASANAARMALGFLEHATGHADRAIALSEDALAVAVAAEGERSREVADISLTLGSYRHDAGDLAGGGQLVSRARELYAQLAPRSRAYFRATSELGRIREAQGRYGEALALHRESYAALAARYGEDSVAVQPALSDIGNTLFTTGDYAGAANSFARAVAIVERLAAVDAATAFASRTGDVEDQAVARARVFDALVKSYFRLPGAADEAFLVAQRVIESEAAEALAQMAARQASGKGALAALVRNRQDLVARWREADTALTLALADQDGAAANFRTSLAQIDDQISAIDAELAGAFPAYVDLQRPAPLDIPTVQQWLGRNDVLLFYADTGAIGDVATETFLWVVPKQGEVHWLRVPRTTEELRVSVRSFREQMGVSGATRGPKALTSSSSAGRQDRVLTTARELYTALLGEAAPLIAGRNLVIVPSRSLASLPFHALVSEPPPQAADRYREARWLARDHAITILPSVSSLMASSAPIMLSATGVRAPYVAFANPVLTKGPLPPLPETADEARAIAAALGADDAALHLGAAATEASLKQLSLDGSLARTRVIHFATHGLVSGELAGLAEPAIVLTPPSSVTAEDDGLLTASEVTTLRLDADWVILSACNTAASDGGGEVLSGLARAFFYAGARALMVSHWPVNSDSAVRLASGAVSALAVDPAIGRAEALRRAMVAEIERGGLAADPANWAPFIVVGGGR
jgi:CHAT domain-containing protein